MLELPLPQSGGLLSCRICATQGRKAARQSQEDFARMSLGFPEPPRSSVATNFPTARDTPRKSLLGGKKHNLQTQ